MELKNAPLSVRAINALSKAGFISVNDCLKLTEMQLLSIKNLGKTTAYEILEYLKQYKPANDTGISDEMLSAPQESKERQEYLELILALPVSEILFSVRSKNCLKKLKVRHLKNLVLLTDSQIMGQKNAGKRSLREMTDFLNQLDLSLGMSLNPSLLRAIEYRARNSQNPQSLLENLRKSYPERAVALSKIRTQTIKPERLEFYKRCFELYQQGGTLESVAKTIKLTRERIRQILVKGTAYGLFEYKGLEYKYVSKAKLLSDFGKHPSLNKVSKINKISIVYLKRLLLAYHITTKQIEGFKETLRKQQAIEEFNAVRDQLGHNPTTTELQSNPKWRALGERIRRIWGNVQEFRQVLNIPSPPPFAEATKRWIEHRSRLALIRRMQDLDSVRDCLEKSALLNTSEIARQCRLNPMRAFKLTQMLLATGEVSREGAGNQIKYRISKIGGHK